MKGHARWTWIPLGRRRRPDQFCSGHLCGNDCCGCLCLSSASASAVAAAAAGASVARLGLPALASAAAHAPAAALSAALKSATHAAVADDAATTQDLAASTFFRSSNSAFSRCRCFSNRNFRAAFCFARRAFSASEIGTVGGWNTINPDGAAAG